MPRLLTFALLFGATALLVAFAPNPEPAAAQNPKQKQKGKGKAKADPKPVRETPATAPDQLKVAKGFKVELLYSVPKEARGSWVCMTTLPGGKLLVSDQYDKGFYVVTPPPVGKNEGLKIEPLPLQFDGKPMLGAQGLCWAFDSLYIVVNSRTGGGLYRATDADKNGQFEKVEKLREFTGGGGEHGPHAVIKHPDGKRLTVVCGNQTNLTKYDSTLVPPFWGDDHLLPRLPDGNGFMAGKLAPGGAIYNVTPDGKTWELQSVGYRNEYDAAYNRDGDLFTYDADMEWDFNTPWYRPTRVCFAMDGADFGWRNGAGKYPPYYPDNLPGVCDIGPGSPTGVTFGTGAKFPAKYQDAFFICDWSYGKLYAVHLKPSGASYTGEKEEFIAGSPLPLTDIVIGEDGAMYFTTGGRRTQSGLYRVTYAGTEDTAPVNTKPRKRLAEVNLLNKDPFEARTSFEAELGNRYDALAGIAASALESPDRTLRYVARTVLEGQIEFEIERTLKSDKPDVVIQGALAWVRRAATCPVHGPERAKDPRNDIQFTVTGPALRAKLLAALAKLDFAKLTAEQRLDLIRVYQVLFHRLGSPTDAERTAWLATYEPAFPTGQRFVDGELLQVFVYLQSDKAAAKGVKLLADAPTQEEQMEYARSLRMLKTGWTKDLRENYFKWFVKAQTYKGGNSFAKFVLKMKADAEATLSAEEKVALKPILDMKAAGPGTVVAPPRPFVKKYTLEELVPVVEKGLKAGGRDFDNGRKLFAAANCFGCHRFDNEGGSAGPDLTAVAGRFSPKDLLESILDPNKEVSDQYQAVEIVTLDGKSVVGRIVNLNGDRMMVMTNMLDPNGQTPVMQSNVDVVKPSKVSMMPAGLLETMTESEILDLLAYTLSRGDRTAAMFKK